MFSLSQSNILIKNFLWVSHINRWNMNIDGMLTEDEVKKVATQMITKRRLPLVRLPPPLQLCSRLNINLLILFGIFFQGLLIDHAIQKAL